MISRASLPMEISRWLVVLAVIATSVLVTEKSVKLLRLLVGFLAGVCCLLHTLNRRKASLRGTSSATAEAPKPTVRARQLNGSVFELYKPPGSPSMQVVFFHGFQPDDYENAYGLAWQSRDGSCIWPQAWLTEVFPDAHILSISYEAHIAYEAYETGKVNMTTIGQNLMSDLIDAQIGQTPSCPVILIGHSFGGIVLKHLCVLASDERSSPWQAPWKRSQISDFLENVGGMFFYSTRSVHQQIPVYMATQFEGNKLLLGYAKALLEYEVNVDFDFETLCKQHGVRRFGELGEAIIDQHPFGKRGPWSNRTFIESQSSSKFGPKFNIVEGTNQITICRPTAKNCRSFVVLTRFLYNVILEMPETPQNRQYLPKSIIGIGPVLEELEGKLDRIASLGLVGIGGIGKTTLAMELFNDLRLKFDYTCFIKDAKHIQGSMGDAVLGQVYCRGKKIVETEGLGFLRGKRLLLVLDDVASAKDLLIVRILKSDVIVHEDSRFIATSRDSALLKEWLDEVYSIPCLSREASLKLLVKRSSLHTPVNGEFFRYAYRIGIMCGGLPLALEVIGRYLRGKRDATTWENTLQALQKPCEANTLTERLTETLSSVLRLVFHDLEKVEKDIFLDAATVFHMIDVKTAKAAWRNSASGFQDRRWNRLVNLSLVLELPDDSGSVRIGLHEQLLNFGKTLARESGRRTWKDEKKATALVRILSSDSHDVDR